MGITISHGGPDFTGIGDSIGGMFLAKKRLDQEDERFKEIQKRAEQRFLQEQEQSQREKEYHDFRMEGAKQERGAKAAFGEAMGSTLPGYLPPGQAQPSGADPRAAKLAAWNSAYRSIASVDPAFAERFKEAGIKDQQREGVAQAASEIGKSMDARMSKGAYFPRGPDGQPIADDQRFSTRAQERRQRLDAVAQLEPEQAVEELRRIADEDQKDADEIAAMSKTNMAVGRRAMKAREQLAVAAQSGMPEDRMDRAESLIVDLESGAYDKDPTQFSKDFDLATRGMVSVPNPFSFGGGEMLNMDAESAVKFQEALEKIKLLQAQQGATGALARQREVSAELSGKSGDNLQLPRGRTRGPLDTDKDINSILKDQFPGGRLADPEGWDAAKKELESKAGGGAHAGGSDEESLKRVLKALGLDPERQVKVNGAR